MNEKIGTYPVSESPLAAFLFEPGTQLHHFCKKKKRITCCIINLNSNYGFLPALSVILYISLKHTLNFIVTTSQDFSAHFTHQ
jgi:hypothetical protein